MRKLLTMIATLAIAFTALAPSVAAAWPVNDACSPLWEKGNEWAWFETRQESGVLKTGVEARIYVDTNRFQPCWGGAPGLYNGFASQWVALTGGGSGGKNIVQIGVDKCDAAEVDSSLSCGNGRDDTLVYFYAWGYENCNGGSHNPLPKYISTPSQSTAAYHTFTIIHSNTGRVWMYIDDVLKVNISDANLCWLDSPSVVKATYSVERYDHNDGFGANPTHFYQTKYQSAFGTTWKASTWESCGNSFETNAEFNCHFWGADHVGFSTTQR